jgi:hypothetical protein
MFMQPMPNMPQEVADMISANPEGFADAMGSGMEAMTAAIGDGASIADAFEAMGDTMGPLMEDMGMSPEVFDAMGDMVGAAVGPAMTMAPADASPADMGAMIQDGMAMTMPEGTEVPAPVMDAMGDMGTAMGDAGVGCHDFAAEMMPPPGDPGYPMPMDGQGNPVVEPGDPASMPMDVCQSPPMDGACATSAPDMMPPEGGYDHAPMTGDMVMPEPFVMDGDLSTMGDGTGGMTDGLQELEDAIGGDQTAQETIQDGPDQNDVAVGAAIDGATEQGGGVGSGASLGQDFGNSDEGEEGNDSQEVDPSAGMG